MDELRFNRKDGTFILVCLLVLVAGLIVSLRYFRAAFPEASIEFRYNRAQSGTLAERFADSLGWQIPKAFHHASRFGFDSQAKTYLEKELGVEGARPYLGKPIRLWYWQHRWFRPATKEEFRVFVTPGGDIVRTEHEIPEDSSGADIPEDSAWAIAERVLFGTMRQDSANLTFIEAQRVGRPHRADWTFTWRAKGIEPVKGAEYRYSVDILGDQAGGYREWLKVPEEWLASYRKLRSYNDAASDIDGVFFALTAIAMLAVFLIRSRRKDVRWKIALKFGIVAMGLVTLNQLNEFPQSLYWYSTEDAWSGYLTTRILMGLIEIIGVGALIFLLTAAAEPLYRERYGDKLALSRMFTMQGLRTKQAFKSILLGVTLTSFFFAYQIAFYLIAAKNGAWSPSEVPYDNLLNTALPWLAVLAVGFFPAVTEEFISRMFSIPFLQKAFKNRMTWLALLIPAFIWGFGHAGYENQPWWIRGAEVGIAGVVIGIIMLRFGILATLVWHYTVDAMYTAFLLFRSNNVYFVLTAAVATGLLVIPLLLALIAYWRKGRFQSEEGVRNVDEETVAPEPVVAEPAVKPLEAPVITYRKLPNRNRLIGAGILVAGIVASLIPVTKLGDFLAYPVTKEEAVKIFADSLRQTGWADPDTLKMIAVVNESNRRADSDDPLVYLLKHSESVQNFNLLTDTLWGAGRWRVRAWVPENRLRFSGTVHARSGKLESLYPWLPEEMPGDSLTKDSAQVLMERELMRQGEDTSALVLKEYREDARPKRVDHVFNYEAKDGDPRNVAEAKYRRDGSVNGSYVSVGRRGWYKLPETWERARNATTAVRAVREWLTVAAIIAAVVWAMMLLASRARQGLVPWRRALLVAIVPAGIALLTVINQWYLAQAQYFGRIEVPLAVFHTTTLVSVLLDMLMTYILFVAGLALLGGMYPEKMALLQKHERRAGMLDTWIAAAAGVGFALIIGSLTHWFDAISTSWITFAGWDVPEWIAAPLPFLTMMDTTLRAALFAAVIVAMIVYTWNGLLRGKLLYRALLLVGVVFMLINMNAKDPNEWLYEALHTIPAIALVWFLLNYVIAGRTAAFFAAAFGATAYVYVSRAMGTGNHFAVMQAWIFVFIALVVFAVWWAPVWGKRRLPVD